MHEPIKLAIWVGVISLSVTLGCAFYVVIANAGSRNLVLGLGALLGACSIFAVQLCFELRESTTAEEFPLEFTTNYETKSIRSRQPHPAYRNLFVEDAASKILSAASPPLKKEDALKITGDLTVLSVLSYLIEEQFDCQPKYFRSALLKFKLGPLPAIRRKPDPLRRPAPRSPLRPPSARSE
jgi:hypothetical protein